MSLLSSRILHLFKGVKQFSEKKLSMDSKHPVNWGHMICETMETEERLRERERERERREREREKERERGLLSYFLLLSIHMMY